MKMKMLFALFILPVTLVNIAQATTAVDTLLGEYRQQGGTGFSAEAGKSFWNREFVSAGKPATRRCSSCHGSDPRQAGKHARTGKPIKPLAPSVNASRLTDVAEIEKWFKRNCKWTLGRECDAREKGNLLMYLKGL